MKSTTKLLPIRSAIALASLFLSSLIAAPAALAQPVVCLPQVASGAITIDGTETGDWATFTPLAIDYGDVSGNYSTKLATDGTSIYFFTEIKSFNTGAPQAQLFMIAASTRMLQVRPFLSSDTPPKSGNVLAGAFTTSIFGGSWPSWGPPATTNFFRVLQTGPDRWVLEGKIALADLAIGSSDNFDLFLHVDTGTTQKSWPGPNPTDLGDPTTITFGRNRCPDVSFDEEYLNFGKSALGGSPVKTFKISNAGVTDSSLGIQAVAMGTGSSTFFTVATVKDADSSLPPFTLSTTQTATVTVTYAPTTGSTLASPHDGDVEVTSNDPDEATAKLPIAGNARAYVDSVFILDLSGSMLSQDKWVTTEWATEVTAEVVRLFGLPQDKIGAVGFGGPSSIPQSYVLKALNTIGGTPASFTSAFTDANGSYYTPVGYGIQAAHGQFAADTRNHVGMLMSDGWHNRPISTSGAITVPALTMPTNVENNTKSMKIHTVALGHDAGVSVDLLNAVRTHYGVGGSTYNITDDPANLVEHFIEPMMEPLIVNRVPFNTTKGGYPVEEHAHKVLAMVAWKQGITPGDIQVKAYDETGATLQATFNSTTTGYYKGPTTDQPYTYIMFDAATPSFDFDDNQVLKIQDTGGNPITSATGFPFVLVDLNVQAYFTLEQDVPGTGSDLILKARLSEVGRPITDDPTHPVRVEAVISKPDEGFGSYAATHVLGDCDVVKPQLPPFLGTLLSKPGGVTLDPGPAAPPPAGPDPLPPSFAKVADLFDLCGKDRLLRSEMPGRKLFDDGTHGDEQAGDGVYTLRFGDAVFEGSYTVRFRASGTSPTGAAFSRTRTLSTHVRIEVDPEYSIFASRVIGRVDQSRVVEYYVIPRDRFEGYLGPGHGGEVLFQADAGEWLNDLVDHNDGIYSRILAFQPGVERPGVQAVVQGKRISPLAPPRELVLPFVGVTSFDSALGIEDGVVVGGKFNIALSERFTLEIEGGVTFTETSQGQAASVIQTLTSVRYDFRPGSVEQLAPFLTAGTGYYLFRDFGVNDEAFGTHFGGGVSYHFRNSLGLRLEARAIQLEDVFGAGSTTNYQGTLGMVIRFD